MDFSDLSFPKTPSGLADGLLAVLAQGWFPPIEHSAEFLHQTEYLDSAHRPRFGRADIRAVEAEERRPAQAGSIQSTVSRSTTRARPSTSMMSRIPSSTPAPTLPSHPGWSPTQALSSARAPSRVR